MIEIEVNRIARTRLIAIGYAVAALSIFNSPVRVSSVPVRIVETHNNEQSTAVLGTESTRTDNGVEKSTVLVSHVDNESSGSVFVDRSDPLGVLDTLIRLKRKSEDTGPPVELGKSASGRHQKRPQGSEGADAGAGGGAGARASIPLLPKAESTAEAAGGSPSVPGLSQVPGLSAITGKMPGGGGGGGDATMIFGGFTVMVVPVSQNNVMSALQTGQQLMPGVSSMPVPGGGLPSMPG